LSFSNTTHQRIVRTAQFSCCSVKLHFFDSYGTSSPEMNSNDYSAISTAILNKSSSN